MQVAVSRENRALPPEPNFNQISVHALHNFVN